MGSRRHRGAIRQGLTAVLPAAPNQADGMNGLAQRLNGWLWLALAATLTIPLAGCATYAVDEGYGNYQYYQGWWTDADIQVFAGVVDTGSDVRAYSQRGSASRKDSHPAARTKRPLPPEHPGGHDGKKDQLQSRSDLPLA